MLTKSTQARSTSDTDQLEYAHQQQRQQQHQHQHQTRLSNTHRKGIKRMESVTNLLGNILSLDDETKTTSGSTRHNAKLNQTHSTVVSSSLIPAKKRRSLDLDFSSFWKDSKEGNGERLSTSKAKAGATSSTTGTNATSSSGGGGGVMNMMEMSQLMHQVVSPVVVVLLLLLLLLLLPLQILPLRRLPLPPMSQLQVKTIMLIS